MNNKNVTKDCDLKGDDPVAVGVGLGDQTVGDVDNLFKAEIKIKDLNKLDRLDRNLC
jgi:hypothetical protein